MKGSITLEFQSVDELKHLVKAHAYFSALYEFAEVLRQYYKYDERDAIPIEDIRDKYHALLTDYGIDLWGD